MKASCRRHGHAGAEGARRTSHTAHTNEGTAPVQMTGKRVFVALTVVLAAAFTTALLNSSRLRQDRAATALGTAVGAAGRVEVGKDPSGAVPAQWPTLGRLESVTITGGASRLRSHAYVYLPPQYFQTRYAHTRFPGVEVLTGFPGRDADLIQGINFPEALRQLIAAKRAQPMVLVMTRPAVTYPRDTECTDVPAGPQVQTFFAADLPAAAANAYRVRSTGWGAIGISTGGYCAAKLAMLHPDRFPAAVSISGYYLTLRDHTTGDLWGGSQRLRNLNDLEWRLRHLPAPPVSVLTTIGSRETAFDEIPDMRRFVSLVKPPMRVSTIVFPRAGHTVRSFNAELAPTLTWLSRHIPAATRTSR